jgi:hypothetical protein
MILSILTLLSFLLLAAIKSILAQCPTFDKMTHMSLSKSLATSAQRAKLRRAVEWTSTRPTSASTDIRVHVAVAVDDRVSNAARLRDQTQEAAERVVDSRVFEIQGTCEEVEVANSGVRASRLSRRSTDSVEIHVVEGNHCFVEARCESV